MDQTTAHQTTNAPAATEPDFSFIDGLSTATVAPANGTFLTKLVTFAPNIDPETGTVTQWKLTLDAAEEIPDNQKPPQSIADGSRLGTFGVFISPSQYRSLDECAKTAKEFVQALNGIIRDLRKDPGYKQADAAYMALDSTHKRPTFTGTPPVLDDATELYSQWDGTLVLATLNTRVGKDGVQRTDLRGIAAANTPRATKK